MGRFNNQAIGDSGKATGLRNAFVALLLFSGVTCFFGLHSGPPLGDHEAINAVAARKAFVSGEWVIPQFAGGPRIRKPPLGIWLIGVSSYLSGQPDDALPVTTFSARLPSAIAGFANVLAVCWLGTMLYNRRCGLVAGFICAGCVATILYARNAQVDMVMTLFTTLSFACFWRGALAGSTNKPYLVAFYVAFALAMLAKAPLPLAMVALPLGVYWFVTLPIQETVTGSDAAAFEIRRCLRSVRQQVIRLRELWLAPGLLIILVIAGAWPLYVLMKVDHAAALWHIEYLDRFTGEMTARSKPLWYYVPLVFGLTVPFAGSIPSAVTAAFVQRYMSQRRGLLFVFTWAAVSVLFLSVAAFKRPHYLLSTIPAFCLLLTPVVDRLFFGGVPAQQRAVRLGCYVVPVLLVPGFLAGGLVVDRRYPAMTTAFTVAATGATLLWTAAAGLYLRKARVAAFTLLNMGVLWLLLVGWPAVGRALPLNAEGEALAAALRANGAGPDDEIIWVDRRPNASVEFYSGLVMERLIDTNVIAGLRPDRDSESASLIREALKRLREKLEAGSDVYFVVRHKYYTLLSQAMRLPVKMVARVQNFRRDPEDDLVVFVRASKSVTSNGVRMGDGGVGETADASIR